MCTMYMYIVSLGLKSKYNTITEHILIILKRITFDSFKSHLDYLGSNLISLLTHLDTKAYV